MFLYYYQNFYMNTTFVLKGISDSEVWTFVMHNTYKFALENTFRSYITYLFKRHSALHILWTKALTTDFLMEFVSIMFLAKNRQEKKNKESLLRRQFTITWD